MSADDEWRVTTEHSRIVDWTETHEFVPVLAESATGEPTLDLVSDPPPDRGERIAWDRFFDRFEREGLALRYHPDAQPGDRSACELVERAGRTKVDRDDETVAPSVQSTQDSTEGGILDQPFEDARETGEEHARKRAADDPATERMAVSDTGDVEPIVENEIESQEAGTRESTDEESPISDSAGGAEDATIVLDELYEDPGGFDTDPDDEYVVLQNDGQEPIDLTGWTLENGVGDAYEFPDGYTLPARERVTIYSGRGTDTETELHWGAADAIWDQEGGTVIVRSPGGGEVVREPFKG